jgi:hypothetical protein
VLSHTPIEPFVDNDSLNAIKD